MYTEEHNIKSLFEQLGLGSSDAQIKQFLHNHKLSGTDTIENASFWNASQATFIHDAKQQDAEWALVVDELDAMLRHDN